MRSRSAGRPCGRTAAGACATRRGHGSRRGNLLCTRGLVRELENLERRARVAAGTSGDHLRDLAGDLGLEERSSPLDDRDDVFLGEGVELDHRAAREKRRVHLEVRVLRRRPDQRHETVLDRVQHRVLLRLVEAMDLVDEEDRAEAVRAEPFACGRDDAADVVDPGGDGGDLLERGAGPLGDDASDRRLAGAGRAEEDHRGRPVLFDRQPERRARAQDVLLSDELLERARSEANREGRVLQLAILRGLGEEVSHAAKYAQAVAPHSDPGPEPEDYSQPVLEGGAPSDYERYLNTEGLLALQKGPGRVGAPRRAPLPGHAPVLRAVAQARRERRRRGDATDRGGRPSGRSSPARARARSASAT